MLLRYLLLPFLVMSSLFGGLLIKEVDTPWHRAQRFQPKTERGPRRPSSPFLSGDFFRTRADHVYDEASQGFNPAHVHEGDRIFVSTYFLYQFIQKYHSAIPNPYVLITHNSIWPVPGPMRYLLEDPKIIAWYALNVDGTEHEKLHPLPLGVPNYYVNRFYAKALSKACSKNLSKKHLLYLNMNPKTYPNERFEVLNHFKNKPYVFFRSKTKLEVYFQDIKASKFVLSPRGNGLDCHRTYEVLYLGAYPIVKTSPLDPLFEDLPVLIVNDWSEITEELLEETYKAFSAQDFDRDKLKFSYWESCLGKS